MRHRRMDDPAGQMDSELNRIRKTRLQKKQTGFFYLMAELLLRIRLLYRNSTSCPWKSTN